MRDYIDFLTYLLSGKIYCVKLRKVAAIESLLYQLKTDFANAIETLKSTEQRFARLFLLYRVFGIIISIVANYVLANIVSEYTS